MLKRIELQNYRCFENSSLSFRQLTIIVGNNNSGKSTVIEALRIVSTVVKKYKTAKYQSPPNGLGLGHGEIGFSVNLDHLKIDLRTIIFQLNQGINAVIVAHFDNKSKIVITATEDIVFANVYDINSELIKTRSMAQNVDLCEICIMPQIGLIREEETKLQPETVLRHIDTRLSSRHFRNELLLYKNECFETFKSLAESTWPGLRIQGLEYRALESEYITLLIYDGGFSAEIGNMGSGIQMWLQIIWFISHCNENATIILDEPDVYMHPDMQSKILRLVKNNYKQTIIATHSVEIISEVEPHYIVNIDKASRRMQYANDSKAVQKIIDIIGSSQNLSLIRLGSARKCIFVEGKDMTLLSRFHNILYPDSSISLNDFPSVALGGWSRFDEALGAARLFFEQTGGAFQTICMLDRDYHLQDEIDELYKKAEENHLVLIVWNRKELENYLLIPAAIFRITQQPEEKYKEFLQIFEETINTMKNEVIYSFTDQYQIFDRKSGAGNASRSANEYVNSRWIDLDNKLSMVNGKDAISMINNFMGANFEKSCSSNKILRHIKKEDIDLQLVEAITTILAR